MGRKSVIMINFSGQDQSQVDWSSLYTNIIMNCTHTAWNRPGDHLSHTHTHKCTHACASLNCVIHDVCVMQLPRAFALALDVSEWLHSFGKVARLAQGTHTHIDTHMSGKVARLRVCDARCDVKYKANRDSTRGTEQFLITQLCQQQQQHQQGKHLQAFSHTSTQ